MKAYKCSSCHKLIQSVGVVKRNKNSDLFILCKKCSKKFESINEAVELMIVPVSKKTFSYIKKTKKYYYPMHYTRKGAEYIAFYVTRKAEIEYYAKVKRIRINVNKIDLPYNVNSLKNPVDGCLYKIHELNNLHKIEKPVLKGKSGAIQNIRNTTLAKLEKAKFLKDL